MGPVLSDAGPSPNIVASGPVNKTRDISQHKACTIATPRLPNLHNA